MRRIAERAMLLRDRTRLPDGFTPATEEFQEGWTFVRSGGTHRLGKKIRADGGLLLSSVARPSHGGTGKTQEAAIASALRLALRRVNNPLNVVQIEQIQVTTYPWFVVARVVLCPYQIQQRPLSLVRDEELELSMLSAEELAAVTSNLVAQASLSPEFSAPVD